MTRAILFACLLIGLAAIHVEAAEPQPEAKTEPQTAAPGQAPQEAAVSEETTVVQEEAAEVTEPVIPERELVFEDKEEPLEMKLFAADPGLLQQRFVALVRLDAGQWILPARNPLSEAMRETHARLQNADDTPTRLLHLLVQNAPKERLPSPDLVEALTGHAPLHVGGYRLPPKRVATENRPGSYSLEASMVFEVYAPTREQAKELTRAALALFDYGFSYPVQRDCLLLKQGEQEALAAKQASRKEIEAEMAGYQKQLEAFAEYEDVTPEALNGLITQQRLISVDLAGVRARIGACNKILAGRDLRPSQIEQVEQLQIAAEIELVGLEAQKASIDLIVEKAAQRRELSDKLAEVQKKADSADKTIRSSLDRIEQYESTRKRFMPLAVEGGVIPIHPILWTPAK